MAHFLSDLIYCLVDVSWLGGVHVIVFVGLVSRNKRLGRHLVIYDNKKKEFKNKLINDRFSFLEIDFLKALQLIAGRSTH